MKEIKLHGKHGEGKFALVDDAAKAYNIKATELFGDFANLNVFN